MPRPLLLSFLTAALLGLPALGALPAARPVLFRIGPAVRQVILGLRRVDLPPAWRRRNWTGPRGQGSCVHASVAHLLEWQGRHAAAAWWRSRHGDGETPAGLAAKLDAAGLRYAETRSGDEAFLDWALRTRRGAAVVVQHGAHMVNLVGLDRRHAQILDSNAPDQVQEWPRAAFVHEWRQSGGWAVTLLAGPPTPPRPWVVRTPRTPGGPAVPAGRPGRAATRSCAIRVPLPGNGRMHLDSLPRSTPNWRNSHVHPHGAASCRCATRPVPRTRPGHPTNNAPLSDSLLPPGEEQKRGSEEWESSEKAPVARNVPTSLPAS